MQNTNFFNLVTETRSGEALIKEGIHFKLIKDGLGNEYKVINFENKDICQRQGIISLIPMRLTSRHENKVGFRIVTDKQTGIIYGIPQGINAETKKLDFLKITLNDHETLDLSNPTDAMKWVVIKNSFFLEGSPNLSGKPKYKVVDVEKQAREYLSNRGQKRKAVDIAEALTGDSLTDMARNLGIPPEANSIPTLQMEVIKRAEDNPKQFMDIYDSPTRKELTILKRAISEGIVIYDTVIGWNYNGAPLGQNESMAIEYLKEYPQTCQAIDIITKKQTDNSEKAMAKSESKPILDDKDARIARLEAELAAKESIIKEVSAEKIVNDVSEVGRFVAEGKRLGIRGIHLIKDLDKLKTKVMEMNPDFE